MKINDAGLDMETQMKTVDNEMKKIQERFCKMDNSLVSLNTEATNRTEELS